MTQGIKRDHFGFLEVWLVEAEFYHFREGNDEYHQLWTTEELARADLTRLLRAHGEDRVEKIHKSGTITMYRSKEVLFSLTSKLLLEDAALVKRVPKALQREEVA